MVIFCNKLRIQVNLKNEQQVVGNCKNADYNGGNYQNKTIEFKMLLRLCNIYQTPRRCTTWVQW